MLLNFWNIRYRFIFLLIFVPKSVFAHFRLIIFCLPIQAHPAYLFFSFHIHQVVLKHLDILFEFFESAVHFLKAHFSNLKFFPFFNHLIWLPLLILQKLSWFAFLFLGYQLNFAVPYIQFHYPTRNFFIGKIFVFYQAS